MYDLLLNEDEAMIADTVRDFLGNELPIERLRPGAKAVDAGAVWQEMAQLGWLGVGLPEAAGGSGIGLPEEILIQRECGRHMVSPNVIATVMAAHVADASGDSEAASGFARGERIVSLGVSIPGEGTRAALLDWQPGNSVLLRSDAGLGLYDAATVSDVSDEDCADESLSLAECSIACDQPAHEAGSELAIRLDVLLAAAQTGLAAHACDLAVEYAKMREQFSKPIGSFQAIKHRCADMAVRQRLAWYQTCFAALKLEAGADDRELQVASALLLASEAARENGRACIQIHGGIGFQAECDAHWFVKRALVYGLAGGGEQLQAERIIAAPEPEW